MSHTNNVSALLQQYAGDTGVKSVQKVEQDFVEVVQQVPAKEVMNGLSEAMRSEHTPPFDEMVGQSFMQGDPQQRAEMLNQLLDGAGPAVVQPLVENGMLGNALAMKEPHSGFVDSTIAQQLQPHLVQQIAQVAQQENPAVIDKMSSLYAEDPALVKTLGGVTLSVALGKIAES